MKNFLFALLAYIAGVGSMAAFFWYVQFGMDQPAPHFSVKSMVADCCLFALFPLQHSLLARRNWKDRVSHLTGRQLERSFYVLTSGVIMLVILIGWRQFGPYLYNCESAIIFDIIFYIALILIILSTIALDHSAMFGLKQGYAAWKHSGLPEKDLQTDGLYGIVRHPITSLLIVALWSHRSLTGSRLLFNILFSAYAIAGTWFEERDLVRNFGKRYEAYRANVPAFIPRLHLK
jgi:protein-S-isoprenylcysteine O-methyltransferase Ste14